MKIDLARFGMTSAKKGHDKKNEGEVSAGRLGRGAQRAGQVFDPPNNCEVRELVTEIESQVIRAGLIRVPGFFLL